MHGVISFPLLLVLSSLSAPPIPFVSREACPFECCTYGQWTAVVPMVAYAKERDTTQIAFKISKGDTFEAVTGNVHVLRPGLAKVTRDFAYGDDEHRVSFAAGDTIWLLDYVGEGVQQVWHRGDVLQMESESWGGHWSNGPYPPARLIREPDSEWWVQVRNRRGQVGWIKMPEEGLPDGADACG